jgi:hypothetical protein
MVIKSRILVSALLLFGLLGAGTFAGTNDRIGPERQWALINISNPLLVGRQILMGTYLIVHDDARMTKGEPCTTVYRFEPTTGRQEVVLSFMCLRRQHAAPKETTLTVKTDPLLGIGTLTEFEFAGDTEGHGVPAGR